MKSIDLHDIPYSTEQGIFEKEQGITFAEQAIFWAV
jgi:hypothetical protein